VEVRSPRGSCVDRTNRTSPLTWNFFWHGPTWNQGTRVQNRINDFRLHSTSRDQSSAVLKSIGSLHTFCVFVLGSSSVSLFQKWPCLSSKTLFIIGPPQTTETNKGRPIISSPLLSPPHSQGGVRLLTALLTRGCFMLVSHATDSPYVTTYN
jgi:hypothetical protein